MSAGKSPRERAHEFYQRAFTKPDADKLSPVLCGPWVGTLEHTELCDAVMKLLLSHDAEVVALQDALKWALDELLSPSKEHAIRKDELRALLERTR